MNAAPPRLAVRLLALRLHDQWRDFVLGDLEEEFRTRHAASPRAARRWFWRQTLRCVASPPPIQHVPSTASARPARASMLHTLFIDFRHALRVLVHAPAFALAVVAVLALGIGATTAIFSIVNTVLLQPLPFDEPGRLVRLFQEPPQSTFPGIHRFSVSPGNFFDWKRDARQFDGMAIYRFSQFVFTGGGAAESVQAGAVGADFFQVVGTQPVLGRVFLPEEHAPGQSKVVILSDGFWTSRFGGARDVLDRTLLLDDEPYRIVGVMPARFSMSAWGITGRDLWVPLAYTAGQRAVRENHNAAAVARLKPGVARERAQAEMDLLSQRLEREFPQANAGWGASVVDLQEVVVGDIRSTLVMLLAAVSLVLLIACANVANLLFTRALGRRKEIAIRSALGAGRGRVFQQLLVEAIVLAAAGGALGLLMANASLSAAAVLLADRLPRADEIAIDRAVLLFVTLVSVATGALAGALPALRAGRADLTDALKEGGRHESAIGVRTRRALIVCEVALSLVLLMGAAVMVRSLMALRQVDAGFDSRSVLTMSVTLPEAKYRSAAQVSSFFAAVLERLRALPGVTAAGAIDDLPTQGGSVQPIVLEGTAEQSPRDQPTVEVRKITPGYIRAIGMPLVRGRDVRDGDVQVLLVSQDAAKLLWGETDPIGRRITLPLQSKSVAKEVVGIVGDVKQGELSEAAAPTVYEYTHDHEWRSLALVLRTSVPPATLAPPATAAIRALDPGQPVENVQTMTDLLDEGVAPQQLSALLLGLFASVALTLASVGIYSVLSYIVGGRRREIGIRSALGAGKLDVLRLVVREGMTPTLIGIAAGIAVAIGAGHLMQRLVFGVSATDPLTIGGAAAALSLTALLASLLPAWRAARLDPLIVLRGD